MSLLLKVIKREEITDEDIEEELYDVCEREHHSCNSDCLVYLVNGNCHPDTKDGNYGCDCFKNGNAMLEFIRSKL